LITYFQQFYGIEESRRYEKLFFGNKRAKMNRERIVVINEKKWPQKFVHAPQLGGSLADCFVVNCTLII
jgi:hypothetical protein